MPLKYYLDEVEFNKIPDGEMFATGRSVDSPEGLHMARTNRELIWVAKKGHANDWCVYVHFAEHGVQGVLSYGDKIYDKGNIDKLFVVTDEVWARYRF